MKITFVLPCADLSGGNRVIATYAERLQNRGHQVQLVSVPHTPLTRKQQIRSLFQGKGWPSRTVTQPSHYDSIDVPHHVIDHAPPIVCADLPDADVVVATWWETAEWVNAFPSEKGAKVYLIQHHEVFDYLPIDRVKATYQMPLHKITISRWLDGLMRDEYGNRSVSLVPNSVDANLFHAPARGKQDVPTVGLLYAPMRWKGVEVSLRAFALAQAQIPNLQLLCFGNCPPPAGLLPENAVFHLNPPQTKLKSLYAQCDVWLCGSYCEGFGLTILEAMACRTPSVSTSIGGAIDLIESGRNGYVVPVGDSAELAKSLVQVLKLPESEWQAMSNAAYTTATSYSWDDATDRFEAALQQAIGQPMLINSGC
ncbi:glycosyltransferase family 4 protein [Microcoleus sp. FACHB-1515]|uniref:glycosyltransferase family 4 protein n=1 Tax=Cyanophyceae TaxID=3028117 RepID=UPI001689AF2E|nr:glycosyltransferase family 4 protein [Microcoleus sp. FACHB-1515]MBD2090415.1 glycosyltransferase family 4 protein [Microcoleus sp. FACHB-1515]